MGMWVFHKHRACLSPSKEPCPRNNVQNRAEAFFGYEETCTEIQLTLNYIVDSSPFSMVVIDERMYKIVGKLFWVHTSLTRRTRHQTNATRYVEKPVRVCGIIS